MHRAYRRPNSLILLASPSERQSAEFLRKTADFVSRLGIRPRGDGDNTISLELPNGSRIVGLPGTEATVRGFSNVSLLLIDEAARVEDAIHKALMPMLAVGNGDLWLMSTPWGKRGFFYENWEYGGDHWMSVTVPATQCPRITKEFLEQQRSEQGASWFQQEYMCKFVDNGSSVCNRDLIESALDDSILPLKLDGSC